MQCRRVRDRVHAVERMGEIDEPALLLDCSDRVAERLPSRDLMIEKEADYLALVIGLHLLARDDDQLSAARELQRFLRACEDVVVGDRDRAESFHLCLVEQQLGRDTTVV